MHGILNKLWFTERHTY